MAPRSSIVKDPEVKAAVDQALRDGNTYEEIVATLLAMGKPRSKSAVHRYGQRARETMERFSEAREVAKVWTEKFGEDPNGDVGQLLPQMLHAVAFGQINLMAEQGNDLSGEDGTSPKHVALLAGAIKDLASAKKIDADRVLKIRTEMAKLAAAEVKKSGKALGLDEAAISEISAKVLGIAR